MGNLFTFFDEFFKTLHPNLYDMGDEETVELNNVELEPQLLPIIPPASLPAASVIILPLALHD